MEPQKSLTGVKTMMVDDRREGAVPLQPTCSRVTGKPKSSYVALSLRRGTQSTNKSLLRGAFPEEGAINDSAKLSFIETTTILALGFTTWIHGTSLKQYPPGKFCSSIISSLLILPFEQQKK